jgi:hypothetical protein
MAKYVLKNCGLFLGTMDLSNCHNSLALTTTVKTVDGTVFGATVEEIVAGVKTVDLTSTGYWDDSTGTYTDKDFYDTLTDKEDAAIVLPQERTVVGASPCTAAHMFKPFKIGYTPISGGKGEMRKFTATAKGWGDLYSGKLLHYALRTSSPGSGTACNCGALSAGQTLYGALCFYNCNCTNLQVLIQSAPTESFVAPTTRITFSTVSTTTSEWKTLGPGAITDTWWRVYWSFTGTAAGFAVAMAIL